MLNLPVEVGLWSASENVTERQRSLSQVILQALGQECDTQGSLRTVVSNAVLTAFSHTQQLSNVS
ncbi:hypothetical protein [Nostoc sp. CMAA1605]